MHVYIVPAVPEMQTEGRTIDFWCSLHFEASFAKVSASSIPDDNYS